MRTNDEAIANNTANYNPDEYDWRRPHELQDEEAWRQHSIAEDERAIHDCVERILGCGGRARLMEFLNELIKEHRLDQFMGRLGND